MPVLKPLFGITGQSNSTGWGDTPDAPSGVAYDGALSAANTGGGNAYVWWEAPAVGSVELTGGASGSVDSIEVDGTEILSGAVNFNSSLSTTARDVADNINAYSPTSGYRARRSSEVVTIYSVAIDEDMNGDTVVSSTTTITTTDTNMSGAEEGSWEILEMGENHYDPHDIGTSGHILKFGPILSMALSLVQYYGHDCYFVLRGNGGKRIFLSGGDLTDGYDLNVSSTNEGYDEYLAKFQRAMNSGAGVYPAGSIMVHGEEDANNETHANAYGDNITDFHAEFRSDIGVSDLLCIQTQLGAGTGRTYDTNVNNGMITWAALSTTNRTFKTAVTLPGVHYSEDQYETFGQEIADDIKTYFGSTWNMHVL